MAPSIDFTPAAHGLRALVAGGRLPGCVLLVHHRGRTALAEAIGRQAPGGDAMRTDSVFRIHSMTKPIVSLAALQLVERGRLLLSEPVSRWLHAFAKPRVQQADGTLADALREPTVHDLLRHTAGLSYGWSEHPVDAAYRAARIGSRRASNAELAAALGALPLRYQPGTAFAYSRATDVLGAVLEAVCDAPLGDVLANQILRPLGMDDTGFGLPGTQAHRLAQALDADPLTGARLQDTGAWYDPLQPAELQSGGGGLVSTAPDYARFCALLLAGGTLEGTRIASRKTIAWMAADHLGAIPVADGIVPPGYGFGLGVAVRLGIGLAPRAGSAGSFGWSGIGGTVFFVDPQEQLAAIVLAQAPWLLDDLCDRLPNLVVGCL